MNKVFIFFIILMFHMGQANQSPKKLYPKILEIDGQVQDFSQVPTRNLKLKDRILESFHAKIGKDSGIWVDLDESTTLEGFALAEFEMPNISWETRHISELKLLQGRILIESKKPADLPLKVKSPVFEFVMPVGEIALHFDSKTAVAEVYVIQGELVFGALNADETVTLKAGQKVSFQGVLEDNEISYDLLLQGKKVPKGKLQAVQTMTAQEIQSYSFQKRRAEAERLRQLRLRANSSRSQSARVGLCVKPAAQLNQCVWKKETAGCFRKRCTAGGLWKDSQRVANLECQTKTTVQKCDY